MKELKMKIFTIIFCLACGISYAYPRDNGQYAGSPLKGWFDSLRSGNGPCCSDADGNVVSDVDWDTKNPMSDGHYRVRIDGEWVDVPDRAVLAGPNKAGLTMVWPMYSNGLVSVRCFIPGVMI